MDNKDIKIIQLNLFACAYYSGAEYSEQLFITTQDYIKYFGNEQDTDAETFAEYVKDRWEGEEIYVGELDGKHSEVYGTVEVDFWTLEQIKEYWGENSSANDGEHMLNELIYAVETSHNESRVEIMENIKKHVNELIESIDTKVTIECKVPKDKVEELKAFVEQLNK